jgi:hypothetical protein
MQFIRTQFTQYIRDNSTPLFKKPTVMFLNSIYSHIIDADESWRLVKQKTQQTELTFVKDNDFYKGTSFSHVPTEFQAVINKSTKWQKRIQYSWNGNTYDIKMVFPMNKPLTNTMHKKLDKFSQDVVYKIFMWLYVVDKYVKRQCSKELSVYLYFTDETKMLPGDRGAPLDRVNVNTAFTSGGCFFTNEIYLYRHEEWFKVFIHETFHSMALDFTEARSDIANAQILELYSGVGSPKIHFEETYCEFWAEVLNAMYITFFTSDNPENRTKVFRKVDEYLKMEQLFSMFQCAKILNHYGISYDNLTIDRDKRFHENTHIISYYFIKSAFLFHIDDFLKWTLANNGKTLNLKKTPDVVHSYIELLRRLYRSPKYLKCMTMMQEWFLANRHYKNTFVGATLRMTALEI